MCTVLRHDLNPEKILKHGCLQLNYMKEKRLMTLLKSCYYIPIIIRGKVAISNFTTSLVTIPSHIVLSSPAAAMHWYVCPLVRPLRTPETKIPVPLVRIELVYSPSGLYWQHIKHWCDDPSRKMHVMFAVL